MEPEVATNNTQFNTITEEEEHEITDSDSQEDLLDSPDLQGPELTLMNQRRMMMMMGYKT